MAQQNDFYLDVALARANQIEAELAAHRADLAAHRANNDTDSAAATVQGLANLEAEKANLTALYQGYVASQQPAQPPETTPEERQAKPFNRMDWGDVWELSQKSKYGIDEAGFRAGMAEVQRRKARGE